MWRAKVKDGYSKETKEENTMTERVELKSRKTQVTEPDLGIFDLLETE
jgi:hypothetical protein